MEFICNIIFCVSFMQIFLLFLLTVLLNLSKHVKIMVKCELLFENIIIFKTKNLLLIKKVVAGCDKKRVAYRKNSTDDLREESITGDPEEEPITEDAYKDLVTVKYDRHCAKNVQIRSFF